METKSKNVSFQVLVELSLFLIPAIIGLLLNLFVEPFHRGFFCSDESLRLPYKESTISTLQIAIACILLGISLISAVELIHFKRNAIHEEKKDINIFRRNIPPVIQNIYKNIGMFMWSLSVNQFFTEVIKFTVGRLRPHFYDVCLPQMSDGTTCDDPQNHHKYVMDFTCTNSNTTKGVFEDMRLSFPSGHASVSFATAIFCVLFIKARYPWRGSKLIKHVIQIILIAAATYVSLSRVSDHKHHWSDVFAGSLLGTVVSLIFGIFATDFFKLNRKIVKNVNINNIEV